MPPDGTQVGVFGYPGAAKVPLGQNYMATPEHFFAPLGATGAACRHEPQQDFPVPYDLPHRALYQVFLDVRDAAARILENTTLADLISGTTPRSGKGKRSAKKKGNASVLPMVVGGQQSE